MKLTKNFALSEFACKDGTPVPAEYIENARQVAKNIQSLRDEIGEALFINSAYRTPAYNKKVGGAKGSQHLTASATDLTARSYTPRQIKATILRLIKAGKMQDGGIGLYPGFVHYDVGPVRRW